MEGQGYPAPTVLPKPLNLINPGFFLLMRLGALVDFSGGFGAGLGIDPPDVTGFWG